MRKKRKSYKQTMQFIEETLMKAPMPSKRLIQAAEEAGHSRPQIYRALRHLPTKNQRVPNPLQRGKLHYVISLDLGKSARQRNTRRQLCDVARLLARAFKEYGEKEGGYYKPLYEWHRFFKTDAVTLANFAGPNSEPEVPLLRFILDNLEGYLEQETRESKTSVEKFKSIFDEK